jgi:hypothetical protein
VTHKTLTADDVAGLRRLIDWIDAQGARYALNLQGEPGGEWMATIVTRGEWIVIFSTSAKTIGDACRAGLEGAREVLK